MKLILTHEVTGLGTAGDIVEVKDGYGRNFLMPRGLATPWTKGGQKQVDALTKGRAVREIKDLDTPRASRASSRPPRSRSRPSPASPVASSAPSATATSPRPSRLPVARSSTSARSRSSRPSRRSAPTRRPSVCTPRSRRPSPSRSSPPDPRGLSTPKGRVPHTRSPALRHATPTVLTSRVPSSPRPGVGNVHTRWSSAQFRTAQGVGKWALDVEGAGGRVRWSRGRRAGCRGW